MTNEEEILR
jgi:hypothetical protein